MGFLRVGRNHPQAGLAQVNLWFPWDNLDFPFINTVPLSVKFWHAYDSVSALSDVRQRPYTADVG